MMFDKLHGIQLADITRNIKDLGTIGNTLLPVINTLLLNKKGSALTEVRKIDINIDKKANIQRVLDRMTYDKIEAYKRARIVRCSDGFIFYNYRDSSILDDTGMCYELAVKTAALLQIMYPDDHYYIAKDDQRADGWIHFFVLQKTPEQEDYIIDPSKNRQGNISESYKWGKNGKKYNIVNILDIHDERNTFRTLSSQVKKTKDGKHKSLKLPLLSQRSFSSTQQLPEFGINISLDTAYENPLFYVEKYTGLGFGIMLDDNLHSETMQQFFTTNNIEIPLEVYERVIDLWENLKKNYTITDLTVEQYKINEFRKQHISIDGDLSFDYND